MRILVNTLLLLSFISVSHLAYGFDICHTAFNSSAALEDLGRKDGYIKPSSPPTRRRYDLEDFLKENLGEDFFSSSEEVQTIVYVGSGEQMERVMDRLAELEIYPNAVDDVDKKIKYILSPHDLENVVYNLSPKQFFLISKIIESENGRLFELNLR